MRKYKCAILAAPGANCYRESRSAVEMVGFEHSDIHIYDLIEGRDNLNEFDFLFMQGGFSFGDYVRAGGVEGALIREKLSEQFKKFYADGKITLAVCNGFQAAVQAGLITGSGLFGERDITLYYNDCGDFRDCPVHLKAVNRGKSIFLRDIDETIRLPMRNGQGKIITSGYYDQNEAVVNLLFKNDQVAFIYVDPDGNQLQPANSLVHDPTGSVSHIAGLCDSDRGTILGMMPHPEARIDPFNDELWTAENGIKKEADGVKIFVNAMDYCKKNL